jgi:hypothetical protein
MGADGETRVDLLGFDFLADEPLVVLRDPRLLSITVGVAMGSGKSSLLGMTEGALADEGADRLVQPLALRGHERGQP